MHIVIYANPETAPYQRLSDALDALNLGRTPEFHDDPARFCDRFRSSIDHPDVILLMPSTPEELDVLADLRELFENVRTIIILPSQEPAILAKGHRFHPRFMAFQDDDFEALGAVLAQLQRKLIQPPEPPADEPPAAGNTAVRARTNRRRRATSDRIASFIVDRDKGMELAIDAEHVLEAIPVNGVIQPLPAAVDFLEGFMHLREEAIPVINLKKRLGLAPSAYGPDAKVAVVGVGGFRFGLLFDDIKDVLHVRDDMIRPIHPALLVDKGLITETVQLENGRRTLQLLDLEGLFGDLEQALADDVIDAMTTPASDTGNRTYRRFVIFTTGGQHYGMPVEETQEITFLSDIDQTFKNDLIEGSLDLRGHYIPVVNAARLLHRHVGDWQPGADTRILVMDSNTFQYGMVVDQITEIRSIAEEDIMRLSGSHAGAVEGIHQHADGRSIMLITPSQLIDEQHAELQSLARLKSAAKADAAQDVVTSTRHLITAECYLIFSIGRHFAIELNDVQEIIEPLDLMDLPGETGVGRRVLNLRGTVVPVVDLREFYGYGSTGTKGTKLIIARKDEAIVAFEVDEIQTIYKQVQFQRTPSLNPRFSGKEDTLDRLIEFVGADGIKEHVLVVNVGAMMRNHLDLFAADNQQSRRQPIAKENAHGINPAQPA